MSALDARPVGGVGGGPLGGPTGGPGGGPGAVGGDDDGGAGGGSGRGRSASATGQRWTRLVHVYISMIALLVVLFFGFTGLTLNHPEWSFGLSPSVSTVQGTLPAGSVSSSGAVEFLRVSEHLRSVQGVRGTVTDFGTTDDEGFISYRGPGYAADVRFSTTTGAYTLTIERQGLVGVMNDLHKGRDTTSSWSWVIDVAAVFLVAISLTGLLLQLFLKRRRTSALVVAGVGGLVVLVIALTTLF